MEPSQESDVVREVLGLNQELNDAALTGDFGALERLLSEDLVVSDPSNTIRNREQLIAIFRSGQVVYSSVEVSVDLARQLGDLVVIMGTESTTQTVVPKDSGLSAVAASGKTLHRRFTNVFRNEGGAWRLLVKQSTVYSIE